MMNLKKLTAILMTMGLLGIFCAQATVAETVNFTDANLETHVRSYLGIPTAPITDTDMASISGPLNLNTCSVANLEGMQYATNLSVMYANQNTISDLTPLSDLTNLAFLSISQNNLTDISPISEMTGLGYLNLGANAIEDLTPLDGMTSIGSLYLNHNQISDTSPLGNVPNMSLLYLNGNQIEILDLRNSNLPAMHYLQLADNPLNRVLLVNAVLNQDNFNAFMNGNSTSMNGIAEMSSITRLDMSKVDFAGISDFSTMYTADSVEKLSFVNAVNLDGSDVLTLTTELDSLNWINVAGVFDSFSTTEQNALWAWDDIPGNRLIKLFGDANGDDIVDGSDATILASNWQVGVGDGQIATWDMGDFNCDGQVDGSDATILASNWQEAIGHLKAVPEPATLTMLLILAGLGIFWKKSFGRKKELR